jgi:predicted Zn-dependent protease
MASTFDAHRMETYLYLKEPAKAERLLAGREKEMPDDYNPPARLARVYLEQNRLPEAEAAVDRALAKMDRGQRRVGILGLKAKILKAEGKPVTAVLREQLDVLRSLPSTQRRPEMEADLERQLGTASR